MFVFSKTNAKRQAYLADMKQKQKMLNDLHIATVGVDDINAKTEQLSKAIVFFNKNSQRKKTSTASSRKSGSWLETFNSLQSKAVKPDKSEHGPNYSEQSIQMTLSGNFNGFYSFLLELEKAATHHTHHANS